MCIFGKLYWWLRVDGNDFLLWLACAFFHSLLLFHHTLSHSFDFFDRKILTPRLQATHLAQLPGMRRTTYIHCNLHLTSPQTSSDTIRDMSFHPIVSNTSSRSSSQGTSTL